MIGSYTTLPKNFHSLFSRRLRCEQTTNTLAYTYIKRKTAETGAALLACLPANLSGHYSYFCFLVYGISRARTNRPVGCCWSTCQGDFHFIPSPFPKSRQVFLFNFGCRYFLPFLRSFSLFIFVFRCQSLVERPKCNQGK